MTINTIIKNINKLLAGEQLVYSYLEPFLDQVIDDINNQLDTTFPTFSELSEDYGDEFTGSFDYDFFPERYIRSVVIKGAAYKWYIMDEEAATVAEEYGLDYNNNLFVMLRDYLEHVPYEYRADNHGGVRFSPDYSVYPYYEEEHRRHRPSRGKPWQI